MEYKSQNRILSLVFLLIASTAFSQTKGKVLDEDQCPISFVMVEVLRTGEHAHTNEEGFFELKTSVIGDSVSFVGLQCKKRTELVPDQQESWTVVLEPDIIVLSEIVLSRRTDALELFSKIDLQTYPVQSSQDVLRKVPGLFIGQHAGGGKAEQIFLRGFDIDHGTDINITVDGLPVNMVSHAHGQGYADLHFLIPETVDEIEYGKGPYQANKGNFATAGHVNFKTVDVLKKSIVQLERGQFNSLRSLTMFDLINSEKQNLYIASEYIKTDGPFVSPQNFDRLNLFGKYVAYPSGGKDKLVFTASYFNSQWDASGQIPDRAVKDGTIGRFGSIDDTEGGSTNRTNFTLQFNKYINDSTYVKTTTFFSKYTFDLFSNFTFFLKDSINGDQTHQFENRQLFGGQVELNQNLTLLGFNTEVQTAVGLRNDKTEGSELSHTLNRRTVITAKQLGDVDETNLFGYLNFKLNKNKWLINPSVRFDVFQFQYVNKMLPVYKTNSTSKGIVSPKLNVLYTPSNSIQFYLKNGIGFHSNDTRVAVVENGKSILPAAYGSDLGCIWKPSPKLMINTALWQLYLKQEFVYVGDEGVVEASGRTQRYGVDLSARYQLLKWMFFDLDLNYAFARSIDEAEGENYIPLAPNFTSTGGISIQNLGAFYGGIRYRYLNQRPANEDNSIVAKGYFVSDLNFGYQWKSMDLGLSIQNVFNTQWNETQFATESRLASEKASVEEIHFTPGTPFFAKLILKFKF